MLPTSLFLAGKKDFSSTLSRGGPPSFFRSRMPTPARDDGPPFLETVWYGGCRNADADFPARILAPQDSSAAFCHNVRVRRLPDGTAEAWFFEDTYVANVEGRWKNVGTTSPKWQRLMHAGIAAALLSRAEAEARATFEHDFP